MELGVGKMRERYFIKLGAAFLLCSLLTATFLAGCCISIDSIFKAKYEKTEQLSAPFAPGKTLDVQTNVGSITVTGADVNNCDVTATITAKAMTKKAAEKLAGEIKIKLEPSNNKLNIRVEKPHRTNERSISVSFRITVPKQTTLQLAVNVGEIRISNITNSIQAVTNVGTIACEEIAGDTDLATNVGEVKVTYSKAAPPACNAIISVSVGGINFTGPADLSAQVNVSANIGSIQTKLPFTVTGKIHKSLNGTVGKGEGKVILRTNVGSINIR